MRHAKLVWSQSGSAKRQQKIVSISGHGDSLYSFPQCFLQDLCASIHCRTLNRYRHPELQKTAGLIGHFASSLAKNIILLDRMSYSLKVSDKANCSYIHSSIASNQGAFVVSLAQRSITLLIYLTGWSLRLPDLMSDIWHEVFDNSVTLFTYHQ